MGMDGYVDVEVYIWMEIKMCMKIYGWMSGCINWLKDAYLDV